jgi:hypothetical protein
MNTRKNVKLVYAQSSDIKARTYIEYRKDMKKKAIVELEIKDWIENKLNKLLRKKVIVEKYGGDKFLWFLRGGGITREPDFVAYINNNKKLFLEFQYADKENLEYFDFKVSKVAKKIRNNGRIPQKDRIFMYVFLNSSKYAFISTDWIVKYGQIGVVPAWGSREAYRVPQTHFIKILKKDKSLKSFSDIIKAKMMILDFQHQLLSIWENDLSQELQKVIDEDKLLKIVPKTLEGFFQVCFILDHINKIPENINLWIVYLLSYINNNLSLKEIAMLTYSLDFLYSKLEPNRINQNELKEMEEKIKKLINLINSCYDDKQGFYKSSIEESPLEETRYALFSINLIEDMIQDAIYYYNANFNQITKIYQNIKDPLKIVKIINN